jgi:hypothetical protein
MQALIISDSSMELPDLSDEIPCGQPSPKRLKKKRVTAKISDVRKKQRARSPSLSSSEVLCHSPSFGTMSSPTTPPTQIRKKVIDCHEKLAQKDMTK